jgi:glycerate kinase
VSTEVLDTAEAVAPRRVLVAMDKFRGTSSARDACDAVADAARAAGWDTDVQPMSDGGEGFRDAVGGDVVTYEVSGPLGVPVTAPVSFRATPSGLEAVIEVADVVGHDVLGALSGTEALLASSAGVGQLVVAADRAGAVVILVGCGGTVTSDGGLGCHGVLRDAGGLRARVVAATDVTAHLSGARRFARQKGVAEVDLEKVDRRLAEARDVYARDRGVDVEAHERTGAAGGLAAALFAWGATLASGFDVVADEVGLESRLARATLVITGEGRYDQGSLEGKVVGRLLDLADAGRDVVAICGVVEGGGRSLPGRRRTRLVSLTQRYGRSRAEGDLHSCLADVTSEVLRSWS